MLEDKDKIRILNAAVDFLEDDGFESIKANLDGFRTPPEISDEVENISFIPKLTAKKGDHYFIFDFAWSPEINTKKYALFSEKAAKDTIQFYLIFPKAYEEEIRKLLTENDIHVETIPIDVSRIKDKK